MNKFYQFTFTHTCTQTQIFVSCIATAVETALLTGVETMLETVPETAEDTVPETAEVTVLETAPETSAKTGSETAADTAVEPVEEIAMEIEIGGGEKCACYAPSALPATPRLPALCLQFTRVPVGTGAFLYY